MVEVLCLSVFKPVLSNIRSIMLGMIPLSVPQQPSLVGNKLSFFFAGEEQNKEALQDVEDENQ